MLSGMQRMSYQTPFKIQLIQRCLHRRLITVKCDSKTGLYQKVALNSSCKYPPPQKPYKEVMCFDKKSRFLHVGFTDKVRQDKGHTNLPSKYWKFRFPSSSMSKLSLEYMTGIRRFFIDGRRPVRIPPKALIKNKKQNKI